MFSPGSVRKWFPALAALSLLAAVIWSTSFGSLAPADFSFDNGNEVRTIDPAKASGNPENRIINGLFEGLLRSVPPEDYQKNYGPNDNVPLVVRPGMADLPELSEDGKTYTFRILPGRVWSDGSQVTSHDFAWSWRRMLHPDTASEYSYQITSYVVGAQAYNASEVKEGGLVEVELRDRRDSLQAFPRGTIVRGTLKEIQREAKPNVEGLSKKEAGRKLGEWQDRFLFGVEVASVTPAEHLPSGTASKGAEGIEVGKTLLFCKSEEIDQAKGEKVFGAMHVLPDFEKTVGIATPDEKTLIVNLKARTAYFNDLVAFYPLYPVHRGCVEKYGSPAWTKPGNIVSNGPFVLDLRRIRDRLRMRKNPKYWAAESIKLQTIDAFAIKSETTSLNMYMAGQLDWATVMPTSMIPELKKELGPQFPSNAMLTVYMYRLNVTRPGLDNVKVRKALNLAIDKHKICEILTKAGELPAEALVPPGLGGYESAGGGAFDVKEAQRLLAEAGYPGGKGLPKLEILYNDLDAHRSIAEIIQQFWRNNLGVETDLRGMEFAVALDLQNKLQYDVARAGWIADYPDPNTFLDMFTSTSEQNQTGWKNARFDGLIEQARQEADPAKRMQILHDAEALLMEEQPIIPLYHYVSKNLVKPHVKGFFLNVQDLHPLTLISIEREGK